MANVTITNLPAAGPITGFESVPIVQNGQTLRTTTGAIAAAPSQIYTYLTVSQTPELPNSRYFGATNGLSVTDGGAQGVFNITTTGALSSLVASGTGFQVKTSGTAIAGRSIAVSGAGLSIANGDGIAGDPTTSLTGQVLNLANLSANGLLTINTSGALSSTQISGVGNQTVVTNPNGLTGSPTIGLADNPIIPGSGAIQIPAGSDGQRPTGVNGKIRYNTSSDVYEGYSAGAWRSFSVAGGVTSVSGTANEITATGTSDVVLSLPAALTFTGKTVTGGTFNMTAATVGADTVTTNTATQTLTNKTLTSPVINNTVKLIGSGASPYTPFAQTFSSAVTNFNGYQLNYIQNTNNGSDASVDYVAYNDSSDVDSYFVDMGISSSNYTSPTYTVFPANGGYLYTGGGTSGQASALLLGTSNAASDLIMFTGGTLLANIRATIKGGTGNFLINTSTDTGYKLNVNGAAYFGGASTFGSTVLLNADPTLALQAATKQYVDNQVTAGLHIHEPVRVETTGNLTATYAQGGTTFNITDITGTDTVTTSVSHGLSVNDQIWLYTSAGNGLVINTAYFVFSVPAANRLTLSSTFGGAQITGLTNASGLTYATRANSGVGATLTNAGAQAALTVDGVALSATNRVMVRLQTTGAENGVYTVTTVGSGSTNWVLTRATDSNQVNPSDPNGVGTGDYYFTQEGLLNAGDSHVLTTEPNTMIIGYTTLTYTQFSGSVDYTGGTNITVVGQTINVSGTIAATLGGTGTSTVTTGDLLYGSATDTWNKLPLGVAYKSLIINASGTQVEWNAVPLNQAAAVSGQLRTSNGGTGLSSFTANGVVYASGTGTLATGSVLVFDGVNLGVGVTPSAWSGYSGIQVKNASLVSYDNDSVTFTQNAFFDGSNWKYIANNYASQYEQFNGNHNWLSAAVGTAGASFSYTQTMVLTPAGYLGIGTTFPTEKLDVTGNALISGNVILSGGAVNGVAYLNGSRILTTGSALTFDGTNFGVGAAGAITSSRINPRASASTSPATITPNIQTADQYGVTALANSLTINAPTGTPVDGNKLIFRLLDNGVSRAITWNAAYTVIGVTLPATTTAGKMTYVGCIYNAANTRWDVVAVTTQA